MLVHLLAACGSEACWLCNVNDTALHMRLQHCTAGHAANCQQFQPYVCHIVAPTHMTAPEYILHLEVHPVSKLPGALVLAATCHNSPTT